MSIASPRKPLKENASISSAKEIGYGPSAWPQFAHDEHNTGSNAQSTGPTAPLGLAWEATIPGEKPTFTSPAVVDGQVYFGNSNHHVYALNAATGEERWSYETGRFVASSPAVTDGTVFFGSADGHVYALDVEDGALRWSREVNLTVDQGVTVVEGVVYAGGRRRTSDAALFALDGIDGSILWSSPVAGSMQTTPAVGEGVVVFSDDESYLALNVDDGSERWALDVLPSPETAPVVIDDTAYVANWSRGKGVKTISARDIQTGDLRWTVNLVDQHLEIPFNSTWTPTSMASDGESVYVVLNGEWEVGTMTPGGMPMVATGGWLYKVDVTAQAVDWVTGLGRGTHSGPTEVNGTVFVGESGAVTVVDGLDGTVLWARSIPGDIHQPPTVAEGVVYVGTTAKLLALASAD